MIIDTRIAMRLVVAALFGGLVGYERERHSQPAGLRTHMILAIGSALAMCISIDLAMQYRTQAPNGDPARLAAQVISGIGFLGAGAILRYGSSVKGLTTATSLWTVAIIGLAVGAGHYVSGLIATLLILGVLSILDVVEKRWIVATTSRSIILKALDRPWFIEDMKKLLAQFKMEITSISVSKNIPEKEIEVDAVVKCSGTLGMDELVAAFSSIEGAKGIEIQ